MRLMTKAAGSALLAALVLQPCAHALMFGDKLSLHGYIQNQTGMFTKASFWRDKGGGSNQYTNINDRGTLSMERNTLWLEGHWDVVPKASVHAVVRATVTGPLPANRDALVSADQPTADRQQRLKDLYYDELTLRRMLRELYTDYRPTELFSVRLGRQQVAWGETGSLRLLDMVNPIDSSWHFSSFESFEDVRIPLWMARPILRIPQLNGDLEGVLIPALDNKNDYVNFTAPLESAWGTHVSPNDLFSVAGPLRAASVRNMTWVYEKPGQNFRDERHGVRWKGAAGKLTYSAVYFYTHQYDFVVQRLDAHRFAQGGFSLANPIEVHYIYPRQSKYGGSMEYPIESPVETLVRFEYVYEPSHLFQVDTTKATNSNFFGPFPQDVDFNPIRKEVHNYALVLERPTNIPFLFSDESFFLQAQAFHRFIPHWSHSDLIIDAPSYNDSRAARLDQVYTFAVAGKYRHGTVQPLVLAGYNPLGSGFGQAALGYAPGDTVRLTVGYNTFWGNHPFTGLGFYRDRDEVFVKTRLQF